VQGWLTRHSCAKRLLERRFPLHGIQTMLRELFEWNSRFGSD
jgi:hypothetical protein